MLQAPEAFKCQAQIILGPKYSINQLEHL
jgi:hypothetical protein